jgi:hypothetical protein
MCFMTAIPLWFRCYSIPYKVTLNTAFIVYRIVKQLHVSILYPDRHQGCIKTMSKRQNVHIVNILPFTLYFYASVMIRVWDRNM